LLVLPSRTDRRIADLVLWSALAVYTAVWVAGLGVGLGGEWLLAGGTAATYVGMHVFEMTRRNHCFLSADSTAFPVSLLVFSIAVLSLWAAGHPPLPEEPLVLALAVFCAVFMAGHVAALTYAAALGSVLTFAFRRRGAAETDGDQGRTAQ
jgi:hypothetical protein